MKESITAVKSVAFAIKIVGVYKVLSTEKKEFVMSKQLLRSGTAIGVLVREAEHAESRADFLHKMNIALKEANDTDYWILLLFESKFLNEQEYSRIKGDCAELIRLLVSIVKTTKASINR